MSDAPNIEATGAWRFHVRPVGDGARLESTAFAGASIPTASRRGGIASGPATSVGIASGYASRVHYVWAGAGYEKRIRRDGDQWGDVGYDSLVDGYRPPFLQLDYPKPDLRFFVEAQGESNGRTRSSGVPKRDSGGQILRVGPTTRCCTNSTASRAGSSFRSTSGRTDRRNANAIAWSSMRATFSGFDSAGGRVETDLGCPGCTDASGAGKRYG